MASQPLRFQLKATLGTDLRVVPLKKWTCDTISSKTQDDKCWLKMRIIGPYPRHSESDFFFLFFFFFFFVFLGPHPRHMEVPRLEVQSEL